MNSKAKGARVEHGTIGRRDRTRLPEAMTALRGVGESSIPSGTQPTDSTDTRKGGFDVGATNDFRTLAVEQLAKHLAAAYLTYVMGIDFPAAMRYVRRQPRAGDLWTVAARFIFGAKSLIDRVHGR